MAEPTVDVRPVPFLESRTLLDVVTCIQRHPDNAGGHAAITGEL